MKMPLVFAVALSLPLLMPLSSDAQSPTVFDELLRMSQKDGHGLVFYIKGQQIAGVVIAAPHDGVVEVRNREHDRIVIRLDSVDAIAGR